jgi:putative hydrolase of the HAD superfamily
MDIRGVIFDYGNVLSLPALETEHLALARISGLQPAVLDVHYWNHRRAYDKGDLDGNTFWQAVAGDAGTSFSPQQISQLIAHDISKLERSRVAQSYRLSARCQGVSM